MIIGLATGYWASMTLLTASGLDVFTILNNRPSPATDVALKCGAHPCSMAMLMNACVALGLLEVEDGVYRNAEAAGTFLVKGKPTYLGDALRYSEDLYSVWGDLAGTIRTNKPAVSPESLLGGDPGRTRNFVLAMHNRARGVAASLAAVLDLGGRKRLLDVGGGPGTYSLMLVQRTPGLRATVLDLPGVAEIARELVSGSDHAERIDFTPGDYNALAPFPDTNDVVLMSGMMHRETEPACRRLLAKAFASLMPGGLVVVSDVFFDTAAKTSPPFAALFALNMLLTSDHGAAHAKTEMADWMRAAGFVDVALTPLPPPMPHTVITARRP